MSKYAIFYMFGMSSRHVQAVAAVASETGCVLWI